MSLDSTVDSDWLPATEWCQRYLPCCQPASDVAETLGRSVVRSVQAGDDFELIPSVEMETRYPVEGCFGSEFPAICNHCAVMAVWSRKTLIFFRNLCVFGKTTPYGKIFKILFKSFIATPIDVLCSNFVKFGRREIGEIVRCIPDKKKKISPSFPFVATARIAPKICQGQTPKIYSECFRFHPTQRPLNDRK